MPFDALRLAADRSVRRYDQDGRLHVAVSHLTKATVNGYLGREIPGADALGLDPEREYQLLRHPDELERAVPTFNNIPLLDQHVPVTAADAKRERVIGSTGTDAAWRAPYVDNSLVIWDDKAIALIESGDQRELSSAYRYVPVMQPGIYHGQQYDGVMTQIRANHVALVEDGRVGSDVVVMDAKPKEKPMQTKTALSPRAAYALGHFNAVIGPLLAADQKMPDLAPVFRGITAKNWAQRKDGITAALIRRIKPVLAQDAEIHVHEHIDGLGAGAEEVPEPMNGVDQLGETPPGTAAPEPFASEPGAASDDDLEQKIREFLQDKLDPPDLEQLLTLMRPEGAPATDPDPAADPPPPVDNGGDRRRARDQNPAPPEQDQPVPVTASGNRADPNAHDQNPPPPDQEQPAMDAKIKLAADAAVRRAVKETTERLNAIRDAEKFVRPWIGEVTMAQDSAEDIYRLALDTHGVDYGSVHQDAGTLKALLSMVPKPGQEHRRDSPRMAKDSKKETDQFFAWLPEAKTARVIG